MASAQAEPVASIACGDVAGLDAAITAANAGTGPSTIVLASGCVYTLTTAAGTDMFGSDGLPVVINTVTLVGHATTIQRDVTASDFRIAEVTGVAGKLTVEGITVRYGIGGVAGGCFAATEGGTLMLRDSVVVDCSAEEAGGGIVVFTGEGSPTHPSAGYGSVVSTVEIDDSSVSDNSAGDGGGIASGPGGTVRLGTDYLAGNEATLGGAIYNDGLGLFVGASDLTQNHASEEGGGIYNLDSQEHIAGSDLKLNIAGGKGGGISNYGLSLLANTAVNGNAAPLGGGIWQGGGATVAILSQITGNMVDNCGPLASVPGCFN